MSTQNTKFSCIILAGGQGKRVNKKDKGLIPFKNKTLIQHVIDAVAPQVDDIVISANRNISTYQALGYNVISDNTEGYQGPLAGIAAALPFCRYDWVFIVPCDMPQLPDNVIEKLTAGMSDHRLCIVETTGKLQLVFLMHKSLLASINLSLINNQRRLMQWVYSQQPDVIHFSNEQDFGNLNFAEDFT